MRGFRGLAILTGQLLTIEPLVANPIVVGTSYVFFLTVEAGANLAARTATVNINWFTSLGVLLSTSTGTPVSIAANSVHQVSVIGVAPAGASYAVCQLTIANTTSYETFGICEAELVVGTTIPPWSGGGFIGTATGEIQASYDGGVTWNDCRFGTGLDLSDGFPTFVFDMEAPFNIPLLYRARVVAIQDGQTLVSDWVTGPPVTIVSTYWWAVDPLTLFPVMAAQIFRVQITGGTTPPNQNASITIDSEEQIGVFRGFGEANAMVIRGDIWSDEFDIGMYFSDSAAWENFNTLRSLQRIILLKSDMEGSVYYVVLGGPRPASILSATDRHQQPQRGLTMHATPVDNPPLDTPTFFDQFIFPPPP